MANKIIVIARIAKDAITISSDIGLMDPDYKKVIIIHMSRLSHSHTFIFSPCSLDWHYLLNSSWFVPPPNKTIAHIAAKFCPRSACLKELYRSMVRYPSITSTIFYPFQYY
jgi:hypothetical protein